MRNLLSLGRYRFFPRYSTIIREGSIGRTFYVLLQGQVLVSNERKTVHLTLVEREFPCDATLGGFRAALAERFELASESEPIEENGVRYRIQVYQLQRRAAAAGASPTTGGWLLGSSWP